MNIKINKKQIHSFYKKAKQLEKDYFDYIEIKNKIKALHVDEKIIEQYKEKRDIREKQDKKTEELTHTINESEFKLTLIESDIKELEEELKDIKRELSLLEINNKELEDSIITNKNELLKLEEKLKNDINNLTAYEIEIKIIDYNKQELIRLEQKTKTLVDLLKEKERFVEEYKKVKLQLIEIKKKLVELNKENDQMKQELCKILNVSDIDNESMNKNVKELENKMQELLKQEKELLPQKQQYEELEIKKDSIEYQLSNKKIEQDDIKNFVHKVRKAYPETATITDENKILLYLKENIEIEKNEVLEKKEKIGQSINLLEQEKDNCLKHKEKINKINFQILKNNQERNNLISFMNKNKQNLSVLKEQLILEKDNIEELKEKAIKQKRMIDEVTYLKNLLNVKEKGYILYQKYFMVNK